jgi:rfaE bifunctional protein nucleotidyltransferase chain/domain/rfaE bifunctional protein kinase chain/domain
VSRPLIVVGDCLLDIDLNGRSTRLVSDEPAPVVENIREVARPGGAGLAALLAARMRPTVLVTAIGDDSAGCRLRAMLEPHVELVNLGAEATTVKTRIRANGRTVARLDHSQAGSSAKQSPDPAVFATAAAVLVSDYGLGITSREDVRALVAGVRTTVWDPHPRGARPPAGMTVVTPNQAEAAHFAGPSTVLQQSRALLAAWEAESVAVTCGADGAVFSTPSSTPLVIPAPDLRVADTCGAGDAFAAHVTAALAGGASPGVAVQRAVVNAAEFLRVGGVADLDDGRPTPPDSEPLAVIDAVKARDGRVVMAGGCFDLLHAGHVSYLQAARSLGDCLVVAMNSDASVRALKGSGRPVVSQEDRARVLSALECVDAVIVFDEATPAALLDRVRPDVFAKGGDYQTQRVPEADTVYAYGGEVVVLPTLAGRSSTQLVNAARLAHIEEDQCRTRPA